MLSNISKYAILGLSQIVKNSSKGEKTKVGEIIEHVDIPQAFLSKILQKLAKEDYLSSMKGPNGGFHLTEQQMENSILDIITELEGKDIFNTCFLRFVACNSENPCPMHDLIIKEKTFLQVRLRKLKVKDLLDTVPESLTNVE